MMMMYFRYATHRHRQEVGFSTSSLAQPRTGLCMLFAVLCRSTAEIQVTLFHGELLHTVFSFSIRTIAPSHQSKYNANVHSGFIQKMYNCM